MMFKHILVPTDFSKNSKQALDIALHISKLNDGSVTLLHIIEIIADTSFEEFEAFYTKLENKAWKNMDDLVDRITEKDLEVEKKVIYGNRVNEIVKFADEHDVDLIVLNSHKVDINNPGKGWGTISYKVGILSNCPVMLVK
jgi:universal stress protein A